MRVCVDVTLHFVPYVSTLKMCVTDTYTMSILAKFSRLRRATRARYARWGNLTTLAVTIIPVSTYIGVGTPGFEAVMSLWSVVTCSVVMKPRHTKNGPRVLAHIKLQGFKGRRETERGIKWASNLRKRG